MASFRLHYERYGKPKSKGIVFLHGFLGCGEDWAPIAQALAPAYQCLCVDLPGHGRSVGGSDGDYTFLETAARIIEDVADEARLNTFVLAGYSMGARLALYTGMHFPMRIDGLILESGTGGIEDEPDRGARAERDAELAHRIEAGDFGAFLREWYAQPLFATLQERPDLLERMLARRRCNSPAELARALRGMGTGQMAPLWEEWSANHLPALLIAGEHDTKYVDLAGRLAGECGEAESAVVPNAGHNVHAEQPESYTTLLRRFLEERAL